MLKWYKEIGIKGLIPEGRLDSGNASGKDDSFDMNEMYSWQTNRLFFSPDDSIKDMTTRFCRIVYGAAAQDMEEYYSLIQKGWDECDDYVFYATGFDVYIGRFVVGAGIADGALRALTRALAHDLSDKQAKKIEAIYKIFKTQIELNNRREHEDATARYCADGTMAILSQNMLAVEENVDSPWNMAGRLRVFKNYDTFEDYDKRADLNIRLLWDEKYLYVGFEVHDDLLADTPAVLNKANLPEYTRIDGSVVESYSETYIGGNILNMSEYFGYISGLFLSSQGSCYSNKGVPQRIDTPKNFLQGFYRHVDKDPQKSYYFHVQAIAFNDLGVSDKTALPYGSFVYYTNRYGRVGWKGNGLWSKQNFSEIKLLK